MPNLGALDTLIAVAVVLLLLSLIVQSIQAAIKKVFHIKSKQIEDSLVYLLENALGESRPQVSVVAPPAAGAPAGAPKPKPALRWYNRSPAIRTMLFMPDSPHDRADGDVQKLHDAILQRFVAVGRVAQYGSSALESLSKEDLSKVLASVGVKEFLDDAATGIKSACALVTAARDVIAEIDAAGVTGEAQLKWAAFRNAVSPLFNDVAQLFDAQKKDFKVTLLVSHVLDLRQVDLQSLLGLAASVRAQVAADEASEADAAKKQALGTLLRKIDDVVVKLGTVPARIDEALSPVKARITAVETWYDTVMLSFEERYSRSMRTWSFVIGLIVAIVLNANLFTIYKKLSTDDVARARVIAAQQRVVDLYEKSKAATDAKDEVKLTALRDKLKNDLDTETGEYESFGFEPLQWRDVNTARDVGYSLFGWLAMALLLTLGAPFWHDVLQSLFGVKNLIEKRSGTKSSEQKSGEGSTQTA